MLNAASFAQWPGEVIKEALLRWAVWSLLKRTRADEQGVAGLQHRDAVSQGVARTQLLRCGNGWEFVGACCCHRGPSCGLSPGYLCTAWGVVQSGATALSPAVLPPPPSLLLVSCFADPHGEQERRGSLVDVHALSHKRILVVGLRRAQSACPPQGSGSGELSERFFAIFKLTRHTAAQAYAPVRGQCLCDHDVGESSERGAQQAHRYPRVVPA
eukprot:1021782-Rhodomonas_salina.1